MNLLPRHLSVMILMVCAAALMVTSVGHAQREDPRGNPRTEENPSDRSGDDAVCAPAQDGVDCIPGRGRRTPGGGDKVPHNDGAGHSWPAVTGILWKVVDNSRDATKKRRKAAGPANDELLGRHGTDTLSGAGGHDILWGDWDPKNNNTKQRDVLRGGAGNDWLYPSHGTTVVNGGAGRDFVWAFYGKGTIDCGPGRDTARVRMTGDFKLRNCETVKHFCAFGSDGKGGCRKPGARAATAARRSGAS